MNFTFFFWQLAESGRLYLLLEFGEGDEGGGRGIRKDDGMGNKHQH